MNELVSIIVPVYNRKNVFLKSFASILNQTYRPLEVIVVDDGSEEFTIEEILLETREGITLNTFHRPHAGAQAARNFGLSQSKGKYVIFFDADVIAEKDMIEKMANTLRTHSEAGYTYANIMWGNKKMKSQQFDPTVLKKMNYIHMTSLIRREAVIPLDETIKKFQDWDLWLTLLEKNITGYYIDEFLYKVETGGTISSWLPSFAYKTPWRHLPLIRKKVKQYEEAKQIILQKHKLI